MNCCPSLLSSKIFLRVQEESLGSYLMLQYQISNGLLCCLHKVSSQMSLRYNSQFILMFSNLAIWANVPLCCQINSQCLNMFNISRHSQCKRRLRFRVSCIRMAISYSSSSLCRPSCALKAHLTRCSRILLPICHHSRMLHHHMACHLTSLRIMLHDQRCQMAHKHSSFLKIQDLLVQLKSGQCTLVETRV